MGPEFAAINGDGFLLWFLAVFGGQLQDGQPEPSEVLGLNFRFLTELAEINDDEGLAAWLRETMEHVFTAIEQQEDFTLPLLVGKALDFMRGNLHRDISRDEVVRDAGIHFSRLLKERTGWSFTELLRQCRVDLACDLLRNPEQSLAEVADACGFCNQIYFTRGARCERRYPEANVRSL